MFLDLLFSFLGHHYDLALSYLRFLLQFSLLNLSIAHILVFNLTKLMYLTEEHKCIEIFLIVFASRLQFLKIKNYTFQHITPLFDTKYTYLIYVMLTMEVTKQYAEQTIDRE